MQEQVQDTWTQKLEKGEQLSTYFELHNMLNQ